MPLILERSHSLTLILIKIFIIFTTLHSTQSNSCFGPGLNELGGCGEDELKCPWYRNLARHYTMPEGCPLSDLHFRKFGNCVSDADCCLGSFCCLSICQGVTRCYNPYINRFTDDLHKFTGNPPCPTTHVVCGNDTTTAKPTIEPKNTTECVCPTQEPLTTTTTTPTPTTPTTTTTTTTTITTTPPPTTTPIFNTTTMDPRGQDYDEKEDPQNQGAIQKNEEGV